MASLCTLALLWAGMFFVEIVIFYIENSGYHESFAQFDKVLSGDPQSQELVNLGNVGKNKGSYREIRVYGGRIISEITVTMNGFFRAVKESKPETNRNQNIVMAGCSYMFGLGLSDEQTLSNLLKDHLANKNVYDISHSGWGTHQFLWLLENGYLEKVVKNDAGGWVIYGFIEDHMRRASISPETITYIPSTFDTAYYENVNGKAVYQGTYREKHPWKAWAIERVARTSIGNRFLSAYLQNHKSHTAEQKQLFCAMMNTAQEILQKKGYRLGVFMYPYEGNRETFSCLDSKITQLDYGHSFSDELAVRKTLQLDEADSHPSELLNRKLAEMLVKDLGLSSNKTTL